MEGENIVWMMYEKKYHNYDLYTKYTLQATVDVPELCDLAQKYFNAVHYLKGTPQEKLHAKLSRAALLVQFLMIAFWNLVKYSENEGGKVDANGNKMECFDIKRMDKRFTEVMCQNWFAETVVTV